MTFQIHYDSGKVVHLVTPSKIALSEIREEYVNPEYGTIVKIVTSK